MSELVTFLDRLHARMEKANDMGETFNTLGVWIARLRGELPDEKTNWSTLEVFAVHLRNDFRLKLNLDWSYTFKYDKLHVLCDAVYQERIQEEADKFGITVAGFLTY